MPTNTQDVTQTPTALASTTDDTFYTIQNTGLTEMELSVAASAPASDTSSRRDRLMPVRRKGSGAAGTTGFDRIHLSYGNIHSVPNDTHVKVYALYP